MVLLLYGDDTYRLHQKLRGVIKEKRERYGSKLSFFDIDCVQERDAGQLRAALAPSLWSVKKLVLVRNAFQAPLLHREILQLLSQGKIGAGVPRSLRDRDPGPLGPGNTFLFFEEGNVSKNIPLFRFFERNGRAAEYSVPTGTSLKEWIREEARQYGVGITEGAISDLCLRCGNDLWRLHHVITQLAAYTKRKQIESRHIGRLHTFLEEETVFALTDALLADRARALRVLLGRFRMGESPFPILALLASHVRKQIFVREALDAGTPPYRIAAALSLHPYAARKMTEQVKNSSLSSLQKIYRRVLAADRMIKTGERDPQTALQLFVLNL